MKCCEIICDRRGSFFDETDGKVYCIRHAPDESMLIFKPEILN